MKALNLDIVSPEKRVFKGEVERVTLPGVIGSFTILPRHAPIVSSLKAGKLSYLSEGKEHEMEIRGGFVEMNNDEVSVCIE